MVGYSSSSVDRALRRQQLQHRANVANVMRELAQMRAETAELTRQLQALEVRLQYAQKRALEVAARDLASLKEENQRVAEAMDRAAQARSAVQADLTDVSSLLHELQTSGLKHLQQ